MTSASNVRSLRDERTKPYRGLAAAIILRAVTDYKSPHWHDGKRGHSKHFENMTRFEIGQFLSSRWFEFLCDGVDMDPDALREKIKAMA